MNVWIYIYIYIYDVKWYHIKTYYDMNLYYIELYCTILVRIVLYYRGSLPHVMSLDGARAPLGAPPPPGESASAAAGTAISVL